MTKPLIRLYHVRAETNDGENQDLLVRAKSAKKAEKLWREYYEEDALDSEPMWVAEVPELPTEGVIPWASIRPKNFDYGDR